MIHDKVYARTRLASARIGIVRAHVLRSFPYRWSLRINRYELISIIIIYLRTWHNYSIPGSCWSINCITIVCGCPVFHKIKWTQIIIIFKYVILPKLYCLFYIRCSRDLFLPPNIFVIVTLMLNFIVHWKVRNNNCKWQYSEIDPLGLY